MNEKDKDKEDDFNNGNDDKNPTIGGKKRPSQYDGAGVTKKKKD